MRADAAPGPLRRQLARFLGRPAPAAPGERDQAELRAQVRRLEIRARQAMREGIAGQYQSAFRGRGLEFEEVREYRAGDDVRAIDWNVTARMGRPFIKLYREERDLTTLILVDLSASTLLGTGVMTVHDQIAEIASLFSLAAARRDRIGAVLFDDEIRHVVPPRRGWRHGLAIVSEVLAAEPAGEGTAFSEALATAGRILHRRGVVVGVVDRSAGLPRKPLAALAARHDVVLARVSDPVAGGGPLPAAVPVRDAEGGSRATVAAVDADDLARPPAGIDLVEVVTGRDYLPAVREMLAARERRRGR